MSRSVDRGVEPGSGPRSHPLSKRNLKNVDLFTSDLSAKYQ